MTGNGQWEWGKRNEGTLGWVCCAAKLQEGTEEEGGGEQEVARQKRSKTFAR